MNKIEIYIASKNPPDDIIKKCKKILSLKDKSQLKKPKPTS